VDGDDFYRDRHRPTLMPVNFDDLFSDPGAYLTETVTGYGYITSWRLDGNGPSRPERGGNAQRCDHDAAEPGPQRTALIDSDAVRPA
jgi:hypothetical protein